MGRAGLWDPKGWASWTRSAAGSQQPWLTSEFSVFSTLSHLKRHCEPSFLKEDEFCLSGKPPWNHSSYQTTKKTPLLSLPNFEHHLKLHILFGADYSAENRSPLIRIYWWRLIKLLPLFCNKALRAAHCFFLTPWIICRGPGNGHWVVPTYAIKTQCEGL